MQEDARSKIIFKKWDDAHPKAVFLLVHGLGAHSGRWDFLGEYFLKQGYSSYSVELKGFGKTNDLKGHIGSFKTYYKDILSLYKIIKCEHPGKKVYILGESMGALIAYMTVLKYGELFDGLICISPAFASRIKFPLPQMIAMVLSLVHSQKKQFTVPFTAEMCTRDAEYRKIMDANPDEHRFVTPRLLFEVILAQLAGSMNADKLRVPVLFLLAGDDKDLLVDPITAKRVFKKLKIGDKKLIQYPEMLHALSIELGREKVFEDILEWVRGEG